MDHIELDPARMQEMSAVLQRAADRIASAASNVRHAVGCCCAPGDVYGWLSGRSAAAASRAATLAEGLRSEAGDLRARSDLARTAGAPDASTSSGLTGLRSGATPDPIVVIAILAMQALLQQLIAKQVAAMNATQLGSSGVTTSADLAAILGGASAVGGTMPIVGNVTVGSIPLSTFGMGPSTSMPSGGSNHIVNTRGLGFTDESGIATLQQLFGSSPAPQRPLTSRGLIGHDANTRGLMQARFDENRAGTRLIYATYTT